MLHHTTCRNPKKAFTIVELIIVIAVIGVLAAILIPTFANVIKKANVSSAKSDVKNLNTALVTAAADSIDLDAASLSLDEAAVLLARGDSSFSMQFCTKNGLDYAWSSTYNRFAVVETAGNSVTNVLFPDEMVVDFESMGASAFFGSANLVSTKTLAVASTTKMDAYFDVIDDANGAPVTVQASSSSDLSSLAEMSSSFDQNGVGFPGVDYETDFANVTIEITNDIYLGGTQWTPFGESPKKPFLGKIEGNGHTIYGLTNTGYEGGYEFTTETTRTLGEAYGLIAYAGTIKNGGTGTFELSISDLTIENVAINSDTGSCVGAFIGYVMVNGSGSTTNLTLTNCKASGSITGKNDVGGLIGKFYGRNLLLEGCVSDVNVKAETGAGVWATKAGGLVGYVSLNVGKTVTLNNCVNNGSVTTVNTAANVAASRDWSTAYAGGLIGGDGGSKGTVTFDGCKNTGTITARSNSSDCAGHIFGQAPSGTTSTYILRGANVFTGTLNATAFGASYSAQFNNACYDVCLSTNPGVNLLGYTSLLCYSDSYKPAVKYGPNATINGVSIAGASFQATSYLHEDAPATVSVPLVAE